MEVEIPQFAKSDEWSERSGPEPVIACMIDCAIAAGPESTIPRIESGFLLCENSEGEASISMLLSRLNRQLNVLRPFPTEDRSWP
jgi:hypothetical protein